MATTQSSRASHPISSMILKFFHSVAIRPLNPIGDMDLKLAKLLSVTILSAIAANSQLSAQTIMQNPTACFGRDCNPVAFIAPHKVSENNCYRIENNSIIYDIARPGCNNSLMPASSSVGVEFGNVQKANNRFALYSLDEIKNTVAVFGPKIRMYLTYEGRYEACPSMDSWLNIGIGIADMVFLSCGNGSPIKTFGFTINKKADFFKGDFNKEFGEEKDRSYTDYDLSKCTDDMTLNYWTSNICRLDVDLLQLVLEQM